ncbi:MAG: MFS transporter [Candidatus Paceibacterota bacterium]
MNIIPKIEKVTRDATLVSFFLMFGYRMFSIYFPLFLVEKGMSLPQVGYTFLLIYLPIAIFSPIVGFLNHKINPGILAGVGVLGYGFYAFGMIFYPNLFVFYLFQVILGISAALFFVSMRAILISSPLENYDRAFGWFYSASYYAGAIAPIVGAIFIWNFDFTGVFIFSLIVQIMTSVYCFLRFSKQKKREETKANFFSPFKNYSGVFRKIKEKEILFPIIISFSVLILSGFYQGFGILSLKDVLYWSQNTIIVITAALSLLFCPLSLFLIHRLEKTKSGKNVFQGGVVSGFFSVLFGALLPFLNYFLFVFINLFQSAGSLICDSGRSGIVSKKLKESYEEAGAIDTIFSPLGTALGSLIPGLLIGFLGYQFVFIAGGAFVIFVAVVLRRVAKM